MLFDMKTDPMEARNLLAKKPEVAEMGRRMLEEIVDGDDLVEWDGGGGGYKHASAFSPRSGRFHLELKAITGFAGQFYSYIYKDMPANPGEAWNAVMYARVTEVPGGDKACAQVKMTFLDAKGGKLRTLESRKLTTVMDDYSQLELNGVAPERTVAVRLTPVVSLQGETGTVAAYFDDTRLSSGETVFESGFESGAVR